MQQGNPRSRRRLWSLSVLLLLAGLLALAVLYRAMPSSRTGSVSDVAACASFGQAEHPVVLGPQGAGVGAKAQGRAPAIGASTQPASGEDSSKVPRDAADASVTEPGPTRPVPVPRTLPELPPGAVVLLGLVLSAADDSPVGGVDVYLQITAGSAKEIRHTTTASDGTFMFERLFAGDRARVVTRAEGYISPLHHDTPEHYFTQAANPRASVKPEEYRDFPVRPTRTGTSKTTLQSLVLKEGFNELTFRLEPGIWLSGHVADVSGTGIRAASVEVSGTGMDYGLVCSTGNDGRFRIGPIPMRLQRLKYKIEASNYERLHGELTCTGASMEDVKFFLKSAASLRGRFIPAGEAPKGKLEAHLYNDEGYRRVCKLTGDSDYRFQFEDVPVSARFTLRILVDRSTPNFTRVHNVLATVEGLDSASFPSFLEVRQPRPMTIVVELPPMPGGMENRNYRACIMTAGSISGSIDWPQFDETEQRGPMTSDSSECILSTSIERFRAVVVQRYNAPDRGTVSVYFFSEVQEYQPGETVRLRVKPLTELAGRVHGSVPGKTGGYVVLSGDEGQSVYCPLHTDGSFKTGQLPALLPGRYRIWWQADSRKNTSPVSAGEVLVLLPGQTLEVTVTP